MVFIKFENRQDEARGVDELSRITQLHGYRGGVWAVKPECVTRLDELNLAYRPATEVEIDAALGSIRQPPATVL